jgi:LCP family protein required for cell wall assembly
MSARPSHGRVTRLLVAVSASLACVLAIGSTVAAFTWVRVRGTGTVDDAGFEGGVGPSATASPIPPTGDCAEGPCNFLLLGSDSRAGLSPEEQKKFATDEQIGGTNRADTIMLVHTDPNVQKAIVLSFPRDLWVEIPGHGEGKINGAFEGGVEHGGPLLMAKTVANLTGLPIDHFLFVDLAGFQSVVDTLGGVNMCVPAYDVNTPGWLTQTTLEGDQQVYVGRPGRVVDLNAGLDVAPGCQRMNGETALAFVRARHLPCDNIPDFARIGRQQQFLRAVINQMLRPGQLARAVTLVDPVLRSLKRDAEFLPGDLVYLVGQMQGLSTGAAEFRAVPGEAGWEGSLSVVHMDPSAEQIFTAIRDGRPISDVGTSLGNTPISPANVTVAVIDDASGGKATAVEAILGDAGFDTSPGIWQPWRIPEGVGGTTIVYRPGADRLGSVVSAYLPGVEVVRSAALHGAPVAVVVDPSYAAPPPDASDGGAACPSV